MKILLILFYEFFKVGLFAVGGGLATIPFLSAMGEKLSWFTYAELADMIAISESTPGPMGINMATYVGYEVASQNGINGILGAVTATLGEVAPSIIVIMIIANFLKKYASNIYVKGSFSGMRPAVIGMIFSAVSGMFLSSVVFLDEYIASGSITDLIQVCPLCIFFAVLILSRKFELHPLFWITLSAAAGVVFNR